MQVGLHLAFEQWGSLYTDVKTKRVTLPISCKTAIGAFAEDNGTAAIDMCASAGNNYVDISLEDSNIVYAGCFWIHIGWQTQWVDIYFKTGVTTVNVNWPVTATFLCGVAAHAGSTNIKSWLDYNGKAAHAESDRIDTYAIGIFK